MNDNKRRAQSRRRAFTLLEVLMVVVIIGLLAAFVVPNFFGAQTGAQIDLTQAAVDSGLGGALKMYRVHMGHYPTEDEGGLTALVEPPEDEELAQKWRGPYIEDVKDLRDAWKNELIYQSPGEYNEDGYDLSSPGPDEEEGTDDDITNWTKT